MSVNQPAFRAEGPSVFLNVTAASQNVQVHAGTCPNIRFYNAGTNVVYLNVGKDNTVTAAIATAGSPANGMPLAPGEVEVIRAPGGWIALIAAAAGPTPVFMTPGYGL